MRIIADLHIHSKYSRATSKDMNLEKLSEWSKKKGIDILGTGDFTHPGWYSELKNKLEEVKPGLYKLKNSQENSLFILSAEISSIYSKNGRVRKIHNIVLAPNLQAVKALNDKLSRIGNLWSDGRPILGLDARLLAKIVFDISPDFILIPAHIWTPWFSLFGSNSGFDKIEECFEEFTPQIYAAETGLSSDPEMNWRLSQLDPITLVSNSDCHSPANLAREANVFEIKESDISFQEIRQILKDKDRQKFLYTIEFFPEEGKYHFDGHRSCGVSFEPAETQKHNGICPKCGRKLVIGVMYRVDELADREEGYKPKNAIGVKHLIPLSEIIAQVVGTAKYTKKVSEEYEKLVNNFKNEINILLDEPSENLAKITLPQIAKNIVKMREEKVERIAGYDGVYGIIKVKEDEEEIAAESDSQETAIEQPSLF